MLIVDELIWLFVTLYVKFFEFSAIIACKSRLLSRAPVSRIPGRCGLCLLKNLGQEQLELVSCPTRVDPQNVPQLAWSNFSWNWMLLVNLNEMGNILLRRRRIDKTLFYLIDGIHFFDPSTFVPCMVCLIIVLHFLWINY